MFCRHCGCIGLFKIWLIADAMGVYSVEPDKMPYNATFRLVLYCNAKIACDGSKKILDYKIYRQAISVVIWTQ